MGHKRILGIIAFSGSSPRKFIVITTLGETIIAHGHNLIVLTDDTRAHLGIGILGTHSRKQRHAHKILIPADIILPLLSHASYLR